MSESGCTVKSLYGTYHDKQKISRRSSDNMDLVTNVDPGNISTAHCCSLLEKYVFHSSPCIQLDVQKSSLLICCKEHTCILYVFNITKSNIL
jgi:hypothetical protein